MALTPRDEPVLYIGTAGGLVGAVVVALGAFSDLSEEQLAAISGLLLIAIPPVVALIQRHYVSPTWKCELPAITTPPPPPPDNPEAAM